MDFFYRHLSSLEKKGIILEKKRVKTVLRRLGNPQDSYPSVIIGGTNGKGSTAVFLDSICRNALIQTGLYTSPHLHTPLERIRISGKKITLENAVRISRIILQAEKEIELTYFEFLTVLAFFYFAEAKVDLAIFEVGMGGRLDATSVVNPVVSVITNISHDHQFYLGNTLKKIALEKAGIIKKNSCVVTGIKSLTLASFISEIAVKKKSAFYRIRTDFSYEKIDRDKFIYRGLSENLVIPHKGLIGDHQFDNASSALASAELLKKKGFNIDSKAMLRGIKSARWDGRFEVVMEDPLVITDGAHNPAGAKALAKTLKSYYSDKKIVFIVGIMKDKNISGILKPLSSVSNTLMAVKPCIERAESTERLAMKASRYFKHVKTFSSVSEAIEKFIKKEKGSILVITGSLYTVAEAEKCLKGIKK